MIKSEKTTSILTKELETLTDTQLHDLFTFFYKLNNQYGNLLTTEKFDEFLRSFERNPFRTNFDPAFKKQLKESTVFVNAISDIRAFVIRDTIQKVDAKVDAKNKVFCQKINF